MAKAKASKGKPHWVQYGEDMDRLKRRIETLHAFWVPVMGLDRWELHAEFLPAPEKKHYESPAVVRVQWEYKQAVISYAMPNLLEHLRGNIQAEGAKGENAYLEYIVVHELCHILVNGMRSKKMRIEDEERVVTELAHAFMKTRYA